MAEIVRPLYDNWPDYTEEEADTILAEFESFCARGTKIVNKNGEPVPFIHNEAQRPINLLLLTHIFSDSPKPVQIFIHKPRQVGATVDVLRLEQFACAKKSNFNIIHIMPTDQDAVEIFEKKSLALMEGTYPDVMPLVTRRGNSMSFKRYIIDGDEGKPGPNDIKLNSSIRFASSGIKGSGHGSTLRMAVFDEYAYYQDPSRIEKGILATLPKSVKVEGKDVPVGTIVVYMTTANGHNHAYNLYKDIKDGKSDIIYLFIPWHIMSEYEMEPVGRLKNLTSLNDYELMLCDLFEKAGYPVKTWVRKLQFYDYVLRNECKNDIQMMHANYPSFPEESFSATGNAVLPSNILQELREEEKPFKSVGLRYNSDNRTVHTVEEDYSNINIFFEPEKGRNYIIGADPSDGGYNGDPSSAVVINTSNMTAVASLNEYLDAADFAEILVMLARYYNNAIIVPESNMGASLISELIQSGYSRIYKDPVKAMAEINSQYVGIKVNTFGVRMTTKTKSEAIQNLRKLMLNGIYKDYDPEFIKQAMIFGWQKTPSGNLKAAAPKGEHDDAVMCFTRGTIITTNKGDKDISKIRNGDMVLTSKGYRKVIATGKREADIIEKFGFRCTPEHPFFTKDGIKPFQDITIHDTIYLCPSKKQLSTMAKNTTDTLNLKDATYECTIGDMINGRLHQYHCIDKSMLITTVKYLRDIILTTLTTIHSIMIYQILNALHLKNIVRKITTLCQKMLKRKEMQSIKLPGRIEKILISAKNAIMNLLPQSQLGQHSAQGYVESVGGLRTQSGELEETNVKEDGTQVKKLAKDTVYNLQVEDTPEYYANGVLVHNCRLIAILAVNMRRFKLDGKERT